MSRSYVYYDVECEALNKIGSPLPTHILVTMYRVVEESDEMKRSSSVTRSVYRQWTLSTAD